MKLIFLLVFSVLLNACGSSEKAKPANVFSTEGHTSVMVQMFAYGPGTELFSGVYDNTEIHTKILKALGR